MSSYDNTPATAGPSRLRTVLGVWNKPKVVANPSDAVEVVARVETPTPAVSLPARPAPAYAAYNDLRVIPVVSEGFFTAGAIEDIEKQRGMYVVEEPPTLARMLFIYGFLFFPFWLAGVYILCSPLRPTPDWEAGKTEAEKVQLMYLLRNTEKKWARRCLYALSALITTVFLFFIILKFAVMRTI